MAAEVYFRTRNCRRVNQADKNLCDNTAAIFFSTNDIYSRGAEYMELKYFAVKEEVKKQRVSIQHIRTDLLIADSLTKGL